MPELIERSLRACGSASSRATSPRRRAALNIAEPPLRRDFALSAHPAAAGSRFYFVGIDEARFRKPVEPGDQLVLTARMQRYLKGIWRFSTAAQVGDSVVAHAQIMVAPETVK